MSCRVNNHFPFMNAIGSHIMVGCSCGWWSKYAFSKDAQGHQAARIVAEDHRGGARSVFTETSRLVSSPVYSFEVDG